MIHLQGLPCEWHSAACPLHMQTHNCIGSCTATSSHLAATQEAAKLLQVNSPWENSLCTHQACTAAWQRGLQLEYASLREATLQSWSQPSMRRECFCVCSVLRVA